MTLMIAADTLIPADTTTSQWDSFKTTALPATDNGFNDRSVAALSRAGLDGKAGLIDYLAACQDVASLRCFMDNQGFREQITKDAAPAERLQILYSVSHMLIDGAGNESFAQQWLEAFGHSEVHATKRLAELFKSQSLREITVLELQRTLGLARVAHNPFLPIEKVDPPLEPAINSLLNRTTASLNSVGALFITQNRLAADLLANYAPDRLPPHITYNQCINLDSRRAPAVTYDKESTELAAGMFQTGSHLIRLLPVVAKVYGDNPVVRRQMEEGFAQALAQSDIPLSTCVAFKPQMEAIIQQDFSGKTLQKMLDSTYKGYVFRNGSSEQVRMDFIDAVSFLYRDDQDLASGLMNHLHATGVDLVSSRTRTIAGRDVHQQLLDEAVVHGAAGLAKDLIAFGADPERTGWRVSATGIREDLPSPLERVRQMLIELDDSTPKHKAFESMYDVMLAGSARAAALRAIADLGLSSDACSP